MKTCYLALFFIVVSCVVIAQEKASNFTAQSTGELQHSRNDLMNFVPNEVLIKFKDAATVNTGSRIKAAGINTVDDVLKSYGVTSLEKLFPTEQKPLRARSIKSPQGTSLTLPRIDNIYRISIPTNDKKQVGPPTNIFQLIEELKALPEVEYAEPNYIYSIDNMQPVGPVLTAEDVAKLQTPKQNSTATVVTPNDPLYSQQWYIPAVKADSVWQQTTGDSTQVIAILDTGVDWTHPDLKNKIWTNPNPNTTPDANGVVDDIRGWDYINNDNNPMDDNSHGTHVAGIAAAETNNGIGIAGVCPKAKIMPIKVFQSSGRGDAATIAKGIIYASSHHATVINMSFGSYVRSLAMEDALANAYETCVLVAAAGNDGIDISDPDRQYSIFYPAALSYVIGTQATQKTANPNKSDSFVTDFSNYDSDGPIYSKFKELYNYELKAPGSEIISTIPNGNYRIYQGTSMATPIISGAVCIYKSHHSSDSQEVMWGNFINTCSDYVNLKEATSIKPQPILNIVNYQLSDTLSDGDWDWKADAGETIFLDITVRNTWGQTDSVYVGIKFQEFEDTTTAVVEKSVGYIGTIGSYATLTNSKDLLQIKIKPNVSHDRDIKFELETWMGSKKQYLSKQNITIRVENGTELKGILEDTLRLTPNKYWLISNSFKMSSNAILIIEPGTKLRIDKRLSGGNIRSLGTKDNHVVIECASGVSGGYGEYEYTDFNVISSKLDNTLFAGYSGKFKNCIFNNLSLYPFSFNSNFQFEDCTFKNISSPWLFYFQNNSIINRCNFYQLDFSEGLFGSSIDGEFNSNNIAACDSRLFIYYAPLSNVINSNFLCNGTVNSAEGYKCNIINNYWGTLDSLKIEKKLYHFWDKSELSLINYKPLLIKPSSTAHACVWKVEVDGKDAQDEFKYLEPLGVGRHKFDIYFNRPMNIQYIPKISMGVRYPFNQILISDNGSWSSDSLIYTVYKDINLITNNGLNRIRVIDGRDMDDIDLIPEFDRFNVNIQASTSSSLNFMANPGLGKVKLEWNNNDLEDGLGYNMYRMEQINDSTLSSPVMVNPTLIMDTLYTDFSVTPNKKYYYYYKILRTNLVETDSSKVVSAIPFTASKGDANGDLSVNVLDITSIVAYLLNNNPQPFIVEAADVNSDATINVLDIVGVVNKVLNGAQKVRGMEQDKIVDLFLENDTLFANSNTPIGGIQLDIKGVSSIDEIHTLKALDGFESGNSIISDSLRLIFYSMSGKNIPAGERIPLLKLKSGSKILNAIFGETNGSPIKVNYILTRIPDIQSNMNQTIAELGQNYPNPVNGKTIIPIRIYEPVNEVILQVVNLMGQEVDVIHLENPYIGEHKLEWNPKQNKGLFIYTLKVTNGKQKNVCPAKQMIVQ